MSVETLLRVDQASLALTSGRGSEAQRAALATRASAVCRHARLNGRRIGFLVPFLELKPATTPHRVGTTRFSSSVQLRTTIMVAAVGSRGELFLIIKNR